MEVFTRMRPSAVLIPSKCALTFQILQVLNELQAYELVRIYAEPQALEEIHKEFAESKEKGGTSVLKLHNAKLT